MRAWRLARKVHSDAPKAIAFNGRGAELWGGRWNPVGVPAAYATPNRALAVLEYLVHADRDLVPDDLVFASATFHESDVETCRPPREWDRAGSASAVAYGARWLHERRSLVLAVPSVVVHDETNYVVNPRHPRFFALAVSPVLEPFRFDDRLLRR